jgi:hypothetical protein
MRYKNFLLTIAFCATAYIAHATNGTPGNGDDNKKCDILGGVYHADTKKPLSNVNVVVYNSNKKEKTVVTDGNGNYSFSDLKPGTYKIVFEKDGFKKVTKDKVTIRSDEGCMLNVELDENEAFQILPGLLFTDFN